MSRNVRDEWRRPQLLSLRALAAAGCIVTATALPACGPNVAGPNPAGSVSASRAVASSRTPPREVTPNPSSLHMLDAQNGWGTFFETVLRTTDGGRHWEDVSPGGTGDTGPQSGYFLDTRHAWMIRYGGYSGGQWESATQTKAAVLRTADGGTTWRSAPLPLPGPVSAQYGVRLTFVDTQHGWALAHVGTAMRPEDRDEVALFSTSDGGATWTRLLVPGQVGALPAAGWKVAIAFRTVQDGWITGRSADGRQILYVTHDGGHMWTPATLPLPPAIAHAANGYTILAPTFRGSDGALPVCAYVTGYWPTIDVLRSHDGGVTWTSGALVQANTGDQCVAPQLGFTDPQHGWFMEDTAYAFTTSDGGNTWTPLHPTMHYAQVNGIDFVSRQLGWGVEWEGVDRCSSLPAIVQTTDGGMTWQVIVPPPSDMVGVPHSCPAMPRSS